MAETERFSNVTEWIDVSFAERERTPRWAIEVGIRCRLAGMSLRDASQYDSPPRPAVLGVLRRRSPHQREAGSGSLVALNLVPATNRVTTWWFLDELHHQCWLRGVTILVAGADYLIEVLAEDGDDYEHTPPGNRNAIERVFRGVERRTSSFSNSFSNVELATAGSWLEAFAVRHNTRQS